LEKSGEQNLINKEKYKFNKMSSKGIEPLTAINQFFYREPPLPIGSPALIISNFKVFYILILSVLSSLTPPPQKKNKKFTPMKGAQRYAEMVKID
jgi:hypothetical protein